MANEEQRLVLVRAGEGRRVLAPDGSAVPKEGFRVNPYDPWWGVCLANGDVVPLNDVQDTQMARQKSVAVKPEVKDA
ncbi:hypothetical protein GS501_02425 [Saccharibacter sp. 17.LH.SD]|uniref:hypothetical protein n=1 Tax=Saccharibacter sp. 17.LH.SD TaxID=2689393 RepID=UPI001370D207|nr:hypothetical protein [Saccharibacter sp. 17.LH.SD]MXV43908.1 hypothetical protein [Saccharibacter sp. 17.LH.SD]